MTATSSTTSQFIAQVEAYGARNYAPLDCVLCRGEGPYVWDVDGHRYVDMLSAYSAVNQGHSHPKILRALTEQAGRLALTSRAFHNDKLGPMLQKIAEISGFPKVLPMNSGAEGVETAIKAMRRWGYERKKIPDGKAEILVAESNFHGRTTTIVGFSTDPDAFTHYGPKTPGFVVVPYGDAAAVENAVNERTCGILIEPIQGEAGVRIPPDDYLPRLREICTRRGIVFCLDEIQTGLARTGRMFAWQHSGAKPDLVILGKALSGGFYPISCLAGKADIMDVFTPGTHGSTYGGNPLASAVAVAALEVLEEERLAERAAELGQHALQRLSRELVREGLREVRGRGLLMAIELVEGRAKEVCKRLQKHGVLAKDTHYTTVRLAPPLVISREQLDDALDTIVEVVNEFLSGS